MSICRRCLHASAVRLGPGRYLAAKTAKMAAPANGLLGVQISLKVLPCTASIDDRSHQAQRFCNLGVRMRTILTVILGLSSLLCAAQQEPMPPAPQRGDVPTRRPLPATDGGNREVLESIVIPPIPNAPFFATLATESVKYSADGASMTFVNERHIGRDGRGRIYEERWLLVPKGSGVKSYMNWIQIPDGKKRTLYNCSPQKHVCDLLVYDPADDLASASLRPPKQRIVQTAQGSRSWEDLGTRNILGFDTTGVRETTATNVGVMGNDQPLTSLTEYWHSAQLGLNLLSIRSSPFFGKQTFTITELSAGEPDPELFELPAGYTVHDERKNAPISQ